MKEDNSLTTLLQEWQLRPAPHPAFAEGVWNRIAAESRPAQRRVWPALGRWIVISLPKPAYACLLIAVSALGGLALAGAHAANVQQRRDAQLEQRYLTSIDPVAMAESALHPRP